MRNKTDDAAAIASLALPALSREFGADRSSIEWVLDAYAPGDGGSRLRLAGD